MTKRTVSLDDKNDLSISPVLLNGTQALVRLMLLQSAQDRAAGYRTAGYVTGYRGSPLGAVDMQMLRAKSDLDAVDVLFQPALNEDLAATALWGTQQAELRGEGKYDGVFGLWYGKGPGVDRSGDAMRHANMAGTSPLGGVVMAMGDDHTGESSTVCHQSDMAAMDAGMPVLSPAGVQEILEYGLYGFALSRYSGLWAGLKLMKDTVEVTSVVQSSVTPPAFVLPEFELPIGGLNIRLGDHWIAQEERLMRYKKSAAEAFAHANKIDGRGVGRSGAKIGFVAAGKNWLDLVHALDLLGIDGQEAERLGLTTYKIGQTYPLDRVGLSDWAAGLDLIVVVEEKRKFIEAQIKEALFHQRGGLRIYGGTRGGMGAPGEAQLFVQHMSLDPVGVAGVLADILIEEGRNSDRLRAAAERIKEAQASDIQGDIAGRMIYFCSGCPHSTSTKVPEGSRAYAGIGCHFMAQSMDRNTSGFTHMGAEGANWIGEGPFSSTQHVFQNIGDGTYNHSGIQTIRAAVASGVTMTYKILFNDAVALTGGQGNDGGLGPTQIVRELVAMGIREVAFVHDPSEDIDLSGVPPEVTIAPRNQLETVQDKMRGVQGVSAIVYVQTCAAEKRRRRKRRAFPDPDKRVFINPDVCEGCGDCGVQSNCVSILPLETEFGRKRTIDQSSCNKDFSCIKGFCPSFVTLEGAVPKRREGAKLELPNLPMPELPEIAATHNIVITGVGGTGVVTIGAILAMAAFIDGKGASMMEMTGLAQKGGAVHIHCRIAQDPKDIGAVRLAAGEAHTLIGGDLVVSSGGKTLGLLTQGRTCAIVNSHEIMTGAFTRDTDFRLPTKRMTAALSERLGEGLRMMDASALAEALLGDKIFANMLLFGASWQAGHVPLSHDGIREAITLNGASVEENLRAFELGRWTIVHPKAAAKMLCLDAPETVDLADLIAGRADHLERYQDRELAERYRTFVARMPDPELQRAVAEGYHKVLSYKDEYEVSRLHLDTAAKADAAFDGVRRRRYHLAPPMFARQGPDGRPRKITFGQWIEPLFRALVRMKRLRGTPFDPFGRTAERRMERALIAEYEADLEAAVPLMQPHSRDAVLALARLPLTIRGFGPVKLANAKRAAETRAALLREIRGETSADLAAE